MDGKKNGQFKGESLGISQLFSCSNVSLLTCSTSQLLNFSIAQLFFCSAFWLSNCEAVGCSKNQLPRAPPVLIGFLVAPLDFVFGFAINFDPPCVDVFDLAAALFFLSLI